MPKAVEVLIVIDHLDAGGAQEFVFQICRYLSSDVIRFSVCALRSGGLYRPKIEVLGIPVLVLSPTRDIANLPLIALNLFRLLRSRRYDVVHSLLQASFLFATPISRLLGMPTMHTIVSIRGQMQWWYFPLMSWYQRFVGRYLTPLPAELIDSGVQAHRITPVGAAIDLSEMLEIKHDPMRNIAPFDLTNAYPVALSIGRLHPDKGHEFAIRAWPQVLEAWPHARLLIVGDGEDEARLKALSNQLGLAASGVFTGYRSDLAALFARADILLRTSINEGANFAMTQAMAAGLPVIGFVTAASSEIIEPERNGLLIPLRDHIALANAVRRLAADRELVRRIGEAGRSDMKNHYNITSVMETYVTCYKMLSTHQQNSIASIA
jgi:glycosyltransferase involved in cell wall biosynthesis